MWHNTLNEEKKRTKLKTKIERDKIEVAILFIFFACSIRKDHGCLMHLIDQLDAYNTFFSSESKTRLSFLIKEDEKKNMIVCFGEKTSVEFLY